MQILERIVLILDTLSNFDKPIGVSELSRLTGISKTAAFRIAEELRGRNLLIKDEENRYHVGPKVLLWAGSYHQESGLKNLARPVLEVLREEFGETVHLFQYENGQAYYLDKIESRKSLRMWSKIGYSPNLYSTAGGKAILAFLTENERDEYLRKTELIRKTVNTITDADILKEQLAEYKRRGYSEENGENEEDIRCVAVPILEYTGKPVGAVSVSVPMYRLDDEMMIRIANRLMELVSTIYL